MDSLLAPILSYVLLYKYVAIFVIVYASALIVPFPSNAMLLAVGAFASEGYVSFWMALGVAVVANSLGDITDYALARKYGEAIARILRINRAHFFLRLKEELRTDAAVTVFMTRFAGVMSTPSNFLAGIVGVPARTFVIYDFWGNLIEPFAALSLGYVAQDYWSDLSGLTGLFAGVVAMGVIIFVLARIYRRIHKRFLS